MPMIAMTTSNSIRVKPGRLPRFSEEVFILKPPETWTVKIEINNV